jgi:hypothetical protein
MVRLDLADLLRQAIAAGRLGEPFTPKAAAAAVGRPEWTLHRVRSELVRHCQGNLAASIVRYERLAHGSYRLLADGPRLQGGDAGARPRRRARKPRDLEPTGRP